MIKFYSFVLLFFSIILLSSCNISDASSSLSESNSIPASSISESVPEESSQPESNSKTNYDELLFTCELPDFSDAERTKLPLLESEKWCVNNKEIRISEMKEQLFVQDEIANELAAAISYIDGEKIRRYCNFNDFGEISEVSNEYMIYAALLSTPYLCPIIENDSETWTAIADNPENIVSRLSVYLFEEHHISIEKAFYAEDVEKTFHYLFGNDTEFNPVSIPNAGIRYIPEEGVFLAAEDNYIYGYMLPQIISFSENNSEYYVEAVDGWFAYDPAGNLLDDVTTDDILAKQHINYTFKKAEDGHFIICSISTVE